MPRERLALSTFWLPFEGEHRCTAAFCHEPAVLVGTRQVTRWVEPRSTYQRRRFLCEQHADLYRLVRYRGRWWRAWSEPRAIFTLQRKVT